MPIPLSTSRPPRRSAAPVDPTVEIRFALPSVTQCAGVGEYRPAALRSHLKFKSKYPGAALDSCDRSKAAATK
jgi:hypothetical protein